MFHSLRLFSHMRIVRPIAVENRVMLALIFEHPLQFKRRETNTSKTFTCEGYRITV